jgi:diacylglycerol kinase family enzyme
MARVVDSTATARWEIEADGHDLSGDYVAVEALNIGLVGPGLSVARDADPGDGLLDLVVIDDEARNALMDYLERRVAGRRAGRLDLPVHRFRRAHLKPPQGEAFRIDDRSRPWHGRQRRVGMEIVVRPAAVAVLP